MTQKKMSFGIFQKIMLSMLLVALVPMGVVWFLDYQAGVEQSSRQVDERLATYADNLTNQVDSWVEMNRRMLVQNAALVDMESMQAGDQNPILKSITAKYEWNYLAFTMDARGNNVGRSDGKETKYYGDRTYFTQIIEGAELGKQVLIGKTSGEPALVLSTPIFNTKKDLEGVLAIAMTIKDISKTVTSAKIGETGFAFLLDENGQVVAHNSQEFTRTRKDLSSHPAFMAITKGNLRNIVFEDANGKKILAHMTKTAQGWIMIAQQDYEEAYRGLATATRNALILFLCTLILVSLIAFVIARGLSKPILSLAKVAVAISKGQLDVKINEVDRRDEIGALAQSVERLGASIKYAMEKMKKKKALADAAVN